MIRYILRRMLQFIPVILLSTFIVYALVFAIPGDPIRALSGDRPMPEAVQQALRDQYNLDDNLFVQYFKYMAGVLTGDFGTTFQGRPVSEIVAQRLPVTLYLAMVALIFQTVLGFIAGTLAALYRDRFIDRLVPVSSVARLLRNSLVETLGSDYVRTATAKGLPRGRVVGRHAMRNALIPVVTFIGADLATMIGGAIITESVFNLPGIGQQVFQSIQQQEGTVVVGIVTILVIFFVVVNLIVDIVYAYLDPRIRYE